MSSLSLRRSIVVLVTVASLFGGAAVIRAAAGWTVDAAPLGEKPPDAATLVANLQAEQTRAAGLSDQLSQVTARATDLQAALEAAQEKATTDAASADDLAAQLASAKSRLATLESQLAAAAAAAAAQSRTVTVTTTTSAAATPAPSASGEHEDGHGGDGGDD